MGQRQTNWPDRAPTVAADLHGLLTISNRDWHQLKTQTDRRAGELLAAALVQLIQGGDRTDVAALADQALGWIRGELKDPGCPRH